jgi:hypothetical protein
MKSDKMILMDRRNDLMIVWWNKSRFYIQSKKGTVSSKDVKVISKHVEWLLNNEYLFIVGDL